MFCTQELESINSSLLIHSVVCCYVSIAELGLLRVEARQCNHNKLLGCCEIRASAFLHICRHACHQSGRVAAAAAAAAVCA
jgi:hypothetical protein